MSDSTQRLPNLYQLLGLNPLESNPEKIALAVNKLQTKLQSLEKLPSAAEDRARWQKLLSLSQKYLLNPPGKAQYDRQWQATFGEAESIKSNSSKQSAAASNSAGASSANEPLRWDTRSLDALLPSGDPHAAFDMAATIRSTPVRDPHAAEADLQKLISLLASVDTGGDVPVVSNATGSSNVPAVTATPVSAVPVTATPVAAMPVTTNPLWAQPAQPVDNVSGLQMPGLAEPASSIDAASDGLSLGTSPRSAQSSTGLTKRLRQRKQRSMIAGGILLAAGVGGLVLLGMFLSQPKAKDTLAQGGGKSSVPQAADGKANPARSLTNRPGHEAANNSNPTNSGLLQPGEDVKPLEIQASPLPANSDGMPNEMKPVPNANMPANPNDNPPPAPANNPAVNKPADNKPTEPKPVETKPEVVNLDMNMSTASKPQPSPPAVKLSAEDRRSWRTGMENVLDSLSALNLPLAEKRLQELQSNAKTPLQVAQLERLQTVTGLVKNARQGIVDAIAGLGAADTFKVGSATVSFVEGDETKISVRVPGKNLRYKLEDLPVGMGMALMDLKMDVAHANTLAAKGAYCLLHPKNRSAPNSQSYKEGIQLLQEAADAGAISQEVAQFFKDDYSLADQ